ncbi:DUF4230 domain-containing protein [Clostridium gasigenes]|uniref:DUF4230 domain-containing protein n=1 Tax=Clostridium gasigenes TaxID=94869 RepID=UPI001C0CE808|nr:DUF4230 domain-containing protein [Clostridium gasigenes]
MFIFIFKFFKSRKSNHKTHFKLSLTLAFIFILIGVFLGYKIFLSPKTPPKQWKLTDNDKKSVKFVSEESLINEIKSANKIIPLEIEFSESIIIDESWGNFTVFKKFKKIKFFANCSYAVDLSNISDNDIKLNSLKDEVELVLEYPKVFSVDLDEDKTIYEEVNNGFFRFGDVILTAEEHGVIEREVSKSFEKKMEDPEIYDKAVANTTLALEKLLNQITGSKLSVKVTFKEN